MTSTPPEITYPRAELRWFAQHDRGDTITVLVRYYLAEDDFVEKERYLSEANDVRPLLLAKGEATWDEDDLCEALGIDRAPAPEEPTPEPAP